MKDKWIAIPLAFFLGGLGVHRFYLKQYGFGLIYLVFCWTLIPAFLGIIDGLVWIFLNENNFNQRYNGYKF